jgi:hypothetical protein
LVEASLNNLRLILSIDGEHFQLQAVDYFAKLDKYSNLEFLKWAASCSFFQQPNDLMKSFVLTRKRSKQREGNAARTGIDSEIYFQAFQRILKGLPASSRNTYLKYFAECPADIQYAFSYTDIRSGWKKAGICPIDIVQMLCKWPSFAEITTAQGEGLVKIIEEKLIPFARREGYIDDKTLYDAIATVLPDLIDDEQYKRAQYKILPQAFNRWKCVWINKDGTIRRRKEIAEAKLNSIASRRRKCSDEIQDEYSNMTKANLMVACRSKLLPVSGNVPILKKRLRDRTVSDDVEDDSPTGNINK